MVSKQILLLPFLALFLVVVDSQNASRELSLAELVLAVQDNICVDVEFVNETECLYLADEPLTFLIQFKRARTDTATKRCNRLANQLSKRKEYNVSVGSNRCSQGNSIQATMFVDQLKWVCNTTLATKQRIKVTELREPGLTLCTGGQGGNITLPACSEINSPCVPGLNICRCDLPLQDCPPDVIGCTPGLILDSFGCKCAATSPPTTENHGDDRENNGGEDDNDGKDGGKDK